MSSRASKFLESVNLIHCQSMGFLYAFESSKKIKPKDHDKIAESVKKELEAEGIECLSVRFPTEKIVEVKVNFPELRETVDKFATKIQSLIDKEINNVESK